MKDGIINLILNIVQVVYFLFFRFSLIVARCFSFAVSQIAIAKCIPLGTYLLPNVMIRASGFEFEFCASHHGTIKFLVEGKFRS